jgi:hypothetical protein
MQLSVDLMPWDEFRDGLLGKTLHVDGYDCVFGGADLSISLE